MFYDDIPNVANCSDVAQLYECAMLTINNSKLLRDWVNGSETTNVILGGKSTPSLRQLIQNINRVTGIATAVSAGVVRPDNVTTQVDALGVLSVIISGLIENGGGLVTGSNGKLAVDFSDMPTDKFEKLLKALRLPIWLTSETNFYVNKSHAAASDTLDEGRGLSADKPFKTISAALQYVANNYNFGNYNANIIVSSGTYNEEYISLPKYTSTLGRIVLTGESHADRNNTICKAMIMNSLGSEFELRHIYIDPPNPSIGGYAIACSQGRVRLQDVYIDLSDSKNTSNSGTYYGIRCDGGQVRIWGADNAGDAGLYIGVSSSSNISGFFSASNSGLIQFAADISVEGNTSISVGTVVAQDLGVISAASASSAFPGRLPLFSASGTITGRRYRLTGNAIINSNGRGAEFFPGTSDGLASTGGQYL